MSDGASARYVPLAAAGACVSAAVASARGLQPRICASERPRAAEAQDCTEGAPLGVSMEKSKKSLQLHYTPQLPSL